MKIVLDLTKLVQEGKLTPAQAEELKALAARDTGLLAINILVAFGTIAVAAAVFLLVPSIPMAAAIAALLIAGGLVLSYRAGPQWTILGVATTIIGVLWFSGARNRCSTRRSLVWICRCKPPCACATVSTAIRSSLLSALAALALAATLGSGTAYEHAT